MEENVYKAPESDLVIEESKEAADFYVVSPVKFLILYIGTFGFYHLYWFYKNWSLYKQAYGQSMWPVMRALFDIFFTHSLFERVDNKLAIVENEYQWSYSNLATLYVVFSIIGNICDRLSTKSIGSPFTDVVGLFVFPITVWILYKAQLAINIACEDPEGSRNSQFTLLNYFWIFIGLIVWALIGIGIYDIIIGLPGMG